MKCANCNGAHNANSKECAVIQKAAKLEKDRVLNKNNPVAMPSVSQPPPRINAGNNWPSLSGRYASQEQPTKRSVPQGFLYSDAVAGPSNERNHDSSSLGRGPGCSCSCGNNLGNLLDREFFGKLKKFVLEIFSMISVGESEISKSLLANSALRNSFGVDLTNPATIDKNENIPYADTGKKRPLNSTDEFQSESENNDGVLSDKSPPREENKNESKPEQRKNQKRKKNKTNTGK